MHHTRRYKDTSLEYQFHKKLTEEIMKEIDKEILEMLNRKCTNMTNRTTKQVDDLLGEPTNPTFVLKDLMSLGIKNVE